MNCRLLECWKVAGMYRSTSFSVIMESPSNSIVDIQFESVLYQLITTFYLILEG